MIDFFKKISALILILATTAVSPGIFDLFIPVEEALAAFNQQINYQGKLTNSSNVAVADGTYHMMFRLYSTLTGATTSNIWEEDRSTVAGNRATVTNGLFSVMLGSSTALTTVDFNQTLYLGVEVGGSGGSPSWDGEMSPRKILGAVPAAFVAKNLDGGTATTSTILVTSSSTLQNLTFQNATGTAATTTDLYVSNLASTTQLRSNTANIGFGTLTNLLVNGSSTLQNFTYQNATGTSATTTGLAISGITSSLLKTNSNGSVIAAVAGTDYLSSMTFAFPYTTGSDWGTHNATSTILGFKAGFYSLASSTIGNNTTASGLTIFGGATTTGQLLTLSSTTLQNFTFTNATGTSATTTNLYVSGRASTTELRANTAYFGGNVGIGTTSPTDKFVVADGTGAIEINNSATLSSPAGSSATVLSLRNRDTTSGNTAGLKFEGGSTLYTAIETVFDDRTSGSEDATLAFTTIAAGARGERLRITNTGNIGIGTTSPIANLDIFKASGDASASFTASSTAGVQLAWTIGTDLSDSGKFKISSSTLLGLNDRLVIDGSGLVTIGNLLATGSTTLQNFTYQNATGTSATTTGLAISGITSSLLKTNSNGSVIAAVAGTDYLSSMTFAFPYTTGSDWGTHNATSTILG
ncbi:MAG TPA: hypothetical protein VJC12_03435, partial [Candidatus Paceibacterota bacterium]